MKPTFQIRPLTKKQWARLRRLPAFVWETYSRDVRRMMGFACVFLGVLLLAGCNLTQTIGMGPKTHKVTPDRSLGESYEAPIITEP